MRNCPVADLRTHSPDRCTRRGITLMECIASLTLLSVVVALVAPILGVVNQMRAESLEHQLALLEVANIHERLAAHRRPLTQADLDAVRLSPSAHEELAGPELALTIDDAGDAAVPARRLVVSLSWENAAGERTSPVRVQRYLYDTEARRP